MSAADGMLDEGPWAVTRTAAQERIIAAALGLFARYGVGGTSLQMIADEIGVTKAAVYHHFRTKDDIVVAAAEVELARLAAVVRAAESARTAKQARDTLLAGIVDLAVDRRHTVGSLLSDPVAASSFAEHQMFRDVMHRFRHILLGDDAGPEARIRTATLIAAISGAVLHPFVQDLDDDTLRAELLHLARRFLGLRG
jgi:AcrR family transcriptional regulator